jgi:alkylation response protein AidB-like acyl-CoA dehydrogenase
MDLSIGPEYEEFRQQVRDFLEAHRDEAPTARVGATRDSQILAWQKTLVENGYVGRTVPREYGGFGATPDLLESILIDEEFAAANVYRGMESQGISMFVPTLLHYGSEEQKQTYVVPTLCGEMIWCQGYSEPGSGSDLASLRTHARLDGDEFVINGQKIWTSGAKQSDMMFALIRTEAEASKHAGISYLIISMDTPGLDVRPLKTMTGDSSFNEVFFTDVRVPRDQIVGERGQGWEVGTYTLRHERNMLGRTGQSETYLRGCIDIMRDTGTLDDPVYRDRLVRLQGRMLAMKYHGMRMLTDRLKGRDSGVSGLITKLNGCQINYDICALAIDALGEQGVLWHNSPHVRDAGAWQNQHMYSLGLIIGGGTAQIQKNIISEVGLGMPREPKPAG